MLQDIRFAIRTLAKAPGFTVVVVLTLALGIGANTAIFSLLDQVVLRPLPVQRPEELVLLSHDGPYFGSSRGSGTFSNPMYRDLSERNEVLAGLAASFYTHVNLGYGGNSERATAMLVSGNFTQVLGVGAALGRTISPDDDKVPDAHPVAVLSHGYWTRRFGASPDVLGQTVLVNSHPMTVIGVTPRGFHGAYTGQSFDLMLPVMMKAEATPEWNELERRRSLWLELIGRLKPGVRIDQAQASLTTLYQGILAEEVKEVASLPAERRAEFIEHPIMLEPGATGRSGLRETFQTPLIVLMSMVGLVLLIVCANVASLLIARAAARRKEIAVRFALGANRWQVGRQVAIDSLLLTLGGGVLGVLVAAWVSARLIGFLPAGRVGDTVSVSMDIRVLGFALAVSVVTGLLFGLLPNKRSASCRPAAMATGVKGTLPVISPIA